MPKNIRAIFVSCGHISLADGAHDPDANNDGIKNDPISERKEAEDVTRELVARLQADPQLKTIPVFTIGLGERLNVAAKTKKINDICRTRGFTAADSLLVEIHLNSSGEATANGLEVWYYSGDETAKAFALTLAASLKEATGMPYHGTPVKGDTSNRHGRLGIVRDTIPLAALFELGFISNREDAAMHTDPTKDNAFSLGALNGIRTWMGYAEVEESPPTSAPDSPPSTSTPTPESPDGAAVAGFVPNAEMVRAFDLYFTLGVFNEDSPRDEFNYRFATLRAREHALIPLPPQL